MLPFIPPVTRTSPLVSLVAVWSSRFECILAVGVKTPVEGSNNSAVAVTPVPAPEVAPPVTNTAPVVSNVAVCDERSTDMLPVSVKVAVPGLNSSADEVDTPPATSTLPLLNRVAVK